MPRETTTPSAKDWRNRAGRVRRFLSSIVCSYSPRSMGPRLPGPPLLPTVNHNPHFATRRAEWPRPRKPHQGGRGGGRADEDRLAGSCGRRSRPTASTSGSSGAGTRTGPAGTPTTSCEARRARASRARARRGGLAPRSPTGPRTASAASGSSPNERIREAGGEAVAGAVGVRDRAREWARGRSVPVTRPPSPRRRRVARRGDDEPRRRIEVPGLVPLARVAPAPDERVELDSGLGRDRAGRAQWRRARERARGLRGRRVAAHEIDSVRLGELVPGKRVAAARNVLLADDRDRALAVAVDEREPAALRL